MERSAAVISSSSSSSSPANGVLPSPSSSSSSFSSAKGDSVEKITEDEMGGQRGNSTTVSDSGAKATTVVVLQPIEIRLDVAAAADEFERSGGKGGEGLWAGRAGGALSTLIEEEMGEALAGRL